MKKIVSLALLSALVISSIAPAAYGEHVKKREECLYVDTVEDVYKNENDVPEELEFWYGKCSGILKKYKQRYEPQYGGWVGTYRGWLYYPEI
ncbi:hypothetical protein [Paenibacillus tyrfis]|uniref:hypothetical protein n=1 Tax=Paenibacillus tyrfis TaxID=1501230 RepID=UPI00209EA4FB|nr:hypothetical protein [Paenibacillus tyrfis]MCP1305943.1 hypothetical protein [Paenibacillus tyrfis]